MAGGFKFLRLSNKNGDVLVRGDMIVAVEAAVPDADGASVISFSGGDRDSYVIVSETPAEIERLLSSPMED